jgi:YD repeat-containing protein
LSDTTPPTVAITAPTAGTVTGTTTVTATATDNAGVAGVQFKLDGVNLGAEDTTAPYSASWNTTTATNGTHTITAVARDAAGNSTTSAVVTVTVSNDVTPPVISAVSASAISSSGATVSWTTDESSDSQVEYGPTVAYGSSAPLAAALVTSHSQTLSGLAPNTLYHYRVKSRDAAGNLATSADVTFLTLPTITTGLVGYWAFDAGSGTTAVDSSGNGNTGTLVNGPTWSAGRLNQGLSFDGLSAYVNVPHTTALNAYPLTVAVWIKTNTTTGVRGIVNKYVAGSTNGYQVFLNNGTLCAWYLRDATNFVYDGTACTLSIPGYADNQWHQVVFVVDGAGGRLYVDGLQKATLGWTGTTGAPNTTQPVHIGDYAGAPGGLFSGLIDDVRIYNRALSSTEISNFYGSFSTDTSPPVLSAIAVSAIGATGATINWTTNEASDTQVEYGLTTAYGNSTLPDTSRLTSHSKRVDGLASDTVYHFRVKSRDAAGNLAVSSDSTFKTSPRSKKPKKDWFDGLLGSLKRLF